MKSKLLGLTLFAIMFMSIAFSAEALATKSKFDLYSIMETYNKKIEKAKMDFFAAVKKMNFDAKESIKKGLLSTDEINARSKTAMEDAKDDLRSTIQKARQDVKESLYMLKASTHKPNPQI